MPDNEDRARSHDTEVYVKMKQCRGSGSTRRTLLPALSSHRFTLLQIDGRKRIPDPRCKAWVAQIASEGGLMLRSPDLRREKCCSLDDGVCQQVILP